MADTGTVIAGSGATSGGSTSWTNPGNITANDGSNATMTPSNTNVNNAFLRATNFGFAIPSDATINGVEVSIEKLRNGGTSGQCVDHYVQLLTAAESLSSTSTGFLNPTAVTEDSGSAGTSWTNPNNALTSDNTRASVATTSSKTLLFNYDLSAVPEHARLDAIQIRVEGSVSSTSNTPRWNVWCFKGSSGSFYDCDELQGTPATSEGNVDIGSSSTYSWGHFTPTGNFNVGVPINFVMNNADGNFFVGLYATAGVSRTFQIDVVQLNVFYSTGFAGEGNSKSIDTANWATSAAVSTYGDAADLWRCTLTPAIVNSSDFGVQLRAGHNGGGSGPNPASGNRVANVDYIAIKVTYTPAAGGGPITVSGQPAIVVFIGA